MNEAPNIAVVKSLYDAFLRNDIGFILDQVTEDVVWMSHVPSEIPWSGDYSGSANVHRFFENLAAASDIDHFEPKEYLANGDRVVAIGEVSGLNRTNGMRSSGKWVHIWTISNGRPFSCEMFLDSRGFAESMRVAA